MSRPSRNARRDAANPYGAGAYVNPDDIDLDEDKSDDSGDTPRTGSKRRPGRPRRDDGAGYTPATGRRGRDASDGGQAAAVDPYDHITTSKPMGGMVIYNSDPSTRPQKNPHVYLWAPGKLRISSRFWADSDTLL